MRTDPLDDAASAPHDPAAPAVADGARLWRRMVRWVSRLTRIGDDLTERMGRVADSQQRTGTTDGAFDLRLGWALLSRAARWTRALRTWMREAAAEVDSGFPDLGPSRPAVCGVPRGGVPRGPSIRAPRVLLGRTDCIKGMTAGEVMAQICADLAEAATLLGAVRAERAITRIAKAARALLLQPDETWTKQPPPRLWDLLPAPVRQDAPTGLPAPDTG